MIYFAILATHRELNEYKHIYFRENPDDRISIGWDVSLEKQCDYFWSELKTVLEIMLPC
jgi:hypothetical protein